MSTRPTTLRIGHKGADLLAPGNTEASFRAALAAGVDMIEFDVLPAYPDGHGELYLAHDYENLRELRTAGTLLTLAQGLAVLASGDFAGVSLDVDLKLPGYEDRAAMALRDAGVLDRTIISTMEPVSLAALRALDPGVRLGWSVPRLRGRNPLERPLIRPFAIAYGALYRAALPLRAARAIRAGRCDALMCHWYLVSPRLAAAVAGAGGELYVWTVDDAERIRALTAMDVAGVITNDPRLFGPAAAPQEILQTAAE